MRHSTPGISENARKKGEDIELETRNLGGLDFKKYDIGRTRISRWLGRENEKNVARTRNYSG